MKIRTSRKNIAITLAALICIFLSGQVTAQEEIEIHGGCSLDKPLINTRFYSFAPNQTAINEIDRILECSGLARNFDIRAADVENATAAMGPNGQRMILYNDSFMEDIYQRTLNRWAATFVLAHEIGHHLNGHPLLPEDETVCEEMRADELEADIFAGFILSKMGAELKDAQAVIDQVASLYDSCTHPRKSARLAAIASGWRKARTQGAATNGSPAPVAASPVVASSDNNALVTTKTRMQALEVREEWKKAWQPYQQTCALPASIQQAEQRMLDATSLMNQGLIFKANDAWSEAIEAYQSTSTILEKAIEARNALKKQIELGPSAFLAGRITPERLRELRQHWADGQSSFKQGLLPDALNSWS